MAGTETDAFERRLHALDHESFVAFVADLWRSCGWDVTVEGSVLEASQHGDTSRLLVVPPYRVAPSLRSVEGGAGSIDAVVTPLADADRTDLPRGTPDVPVLDAVELLDRLRYALDDDARERLLATHFGIEPSALDTSPSPTAVSPIRVPRSRSASVGVVGVTLLLLGVAFVLVATGVPFGDASSGTVNASTPEAAGGFSTASAEVYDASPTCTRGPQEVVEVSVSATRGGGRNRGIAVMGHFWNPRHVRTNPRGSWQEMMTSEAHVAFYDAESVTIQEPSIDGDEATVRALATIDGEEREYVFGLGRGDRSAGEDCWMLERFGPA